jgi:hypothetical protein
MGSNRIRKNTVVYTVNSCYAQDGKSWFCQRIAMLCFRWFRLRPVRDDMLVENDVTNFPRPVGMQCW